MKSGITLGALALAAAANVAVAEPIYRMGTMPVNTQAQTQSQTATRAAYEQANQPARVTYAEPSQVTRASYVDTHQAEGVRSFYVAPMFSWNELDSDAGLDDSAGFGLKAGIDMSRLWSVELSLDYAETDEAAIRSNEVSMFALSFDGIRRFDTNGSVTPYGLMGVGVVKTGTFTNEYDGLAISLGGGVLAPVPNWPAHLRAELKARFTDSDSLQDQDDYIDWVLSLGVQFDIDWNEKQTEASMFQPVSVAVPQKSMGIDTDGDNVPDQRDRCPNTARGITVNPRGCEVDTDSDGVVDSQDKCLDTDIGVVVGKVGCALFLDVDDDGVLNEDDKCPNTEKDMYVDRMGCDSTAPVAAAPAVMTPVMMQSDEPLVMEPSQPSSNLPIAQTFPLPGEDRYVASGSTITLDGVEFEYKSTRLTSRAEGSLRQYVKRFQDNRNLVAEVAGHTDSKASLAYNQKLSERRADSVRRFLVKSGVRPSQLSVRGYGETQPVASNKSESGRARNRRVELRILSK